MTIEKEEYKPYLEIVSIEDNDDGSATVVFDVDQETLKHFAGIGLLKIIRDSAEMILNEPIKSE